MPKFLILPLALCVAITLGGCSKSESPTSPPENSSSVPAQLVGTWAVQSATLDGVSTPFIQALHRKSTTVTELMLVNGDGNYFTRDDNNIGEVVYWEMGTLSVDGQNFTFTVKTADGQPLNPSEQKSGHWEQSGDNLTLTIDDGGKTGVIRYVHSFYWSWDY